MPIRSNYDGAGPKRLACLSLSQFHSEVASRTPRRLRVPTTLPRKLTLPNPTHDTLQLYHRYIHMCIYMYIYASYLDSTQFE